jgi:sugar lactone lactonase YvrE
MAVTYRVVFEGKIAAGQERNAVQARLSQIFKGNEQAVKRFFTGRPITIKDQLDWATANKYKSIFEAAGIPIIILPTADLELTMEEQSEPEAPAPAEERPRVAPPKPRPVPPPAEATPSQALNIAAGLVILLIFASLGLRFWASGKLDRFVSLDHVATNGERVAMHAGGRIYLTSRDGRLEQVLDLADLGIAGPVADLELLNDGSLLVGDLEMKKILRCDPAAKSCQPFAPTGDFSLAENFKFLADQDRQLLYIADTNNDRLLVQNLVDSSCAVADNTTRLSYPNDLARDAGDRLYLCDTNRFRIIPFRVEQGKVTEVAEPLSTMGGMPVSPEEIAAMAQDPEKLKAKLAGLKDNLGQIAEASGHAKPFALALGADGNLWAAQLNTVMTNGAIKIISPEGKAVGSVNLEQGAVPVDLVRFNQGLLAADSGLLKAYTIDPATYRISDFGNASFREEMEKIASRRDWLTNFKKLGLFGTIFFALMALGVMVVAKKKGVG